METDRHEVGDRATAFSVFPWMPGEWWVLDWHIGPLVANEKRSVYWYAPVKPGISTAERERRAAMRKEKRKKARRLRRPAVRTWR